MKCHSFIHLHSGSVKSRSVKESNYTDAALTHIRITYIYLFAVRILYAHKSWTKENRKKKKHLKEIHRHGWMQKMNTHDSSCRSEAHFQFVLIYCNIADGECCMNVGHPHLWSTFASRWISLSNDGTQNFPIGSICASNCVKMTENYCVICASGVTSFLLYDRECPASCYWIRCFEIIHEMRRNAIGNLMGVWFSRLFKSEMWLLMFLVRLLLTKKKNETNNKIVLMAWKTHKRHIQIWLRHSVHMQCRRLRQFYRNLWYILQFSLIKQINCVCERRVRKGVASMVYLVKCCVLCAVCIRENHFLCAHKIQNRFDADK